MSGRKGAGQPAPSFGLLGTLAGLAALLASSLGAAILIGLVCGAVYVLGHRDGGR